MALIPNWRRVLLKSWSLWAGAYLPLLILLLPEMLFAVWAVEISPVAVWLAAFVSAGIAPMLRIWDQGLRK